MKTVALILAAGKGERMRSPLHKVLHSLCGRPMIDYVLDAVAPLSNQKPLVAVSFEKEQILAHLGSSVDYIYQNPQDGWGTAVPVKAAKAQIADSDCVLIAFGDMPLVYAQSYQRVFSAVESGADCALLTAVMDPTPKYGRIVREADGRVAGIVEDKDCTPEQLKIKEVNASVYCFKTEKLLSVLDEIGNSNAKGEYYLTDAIALFVQHGWRVEGIVAQEPSQCQGVNDMADLATAEALMRARIHARHMKNGVRLIAPENTYIDASVQIAPGAVIYPGCCLEGATDIGQDATLLPNCRVSNAQIGRAARVESSVILDSQIGEETTVGPNAYIRPNSRIGAHCRIGDFVEIKNAVIGDGTKVSHLTYVGDADLGRDINLGCGVVFVNYDGKNKYRSTVGDHAFIGCNCNLVAPVQIGADAYIAAGSTVTQDVESGALCIARSRQSVKPGWVAKRREKGLLK